MQKNRGRLKKHEEKSKALWEIPPETRIKIYENGQRKNAGRCWDIKEKATQKIIQFEEINQKGLAKEGRSKRHRESLKQYRHKRCSKATKGNSANNRRQGKRNNFEIKCGSEKKITKRPIG